MEILELKSAVTKMKNFLNGLNSKSELAEKQISELKDRLIEIFNLKI